MGKFFNCFRFLLYPTIEDISRKDFKFVTLENDDPRSMLLPFALESLFETVKLHPSVRLYVLKSIYILQ